MIFTLVREGNTGATDRQNDKDGCGGQIFIEK
jgi:hypothetical protein